MYTTGWILRIALGMKGDKSRIVCGVRDAFLRLPIVHLLGDLGSTSAKRNKQGEGVNLEQFSHYLCFIYFEAAYVCFMREDTVPYSKLPINTSKDCCTVILISFLYVLLPTGSPTSHIGNLNVRHSHDLFSVKRSQITSFHTIPRWSHDRRYICNSL